jgi:hypothetical protein
MPSPKAIIKSVDMNEEMQQEAVDVASAALEKFNIEKVRLLSLALSLSLCDLLM